MKREKWFCLAGDGEIVYLGELDGFNAAEKKQEELGCDSVWLFNADQAAQWMSVLNTHL